MEEKIRGREGFKELEKSGKLIYEYDRKVPFDLRIENVNEFDNCDLLTFNTVYEPDIPESRKIYVYQFHAQNPKMILLFLHGIGNGHVTYLMWFGEYFAKKNVEVFLLYILTICNELKLIGMEENHSSIILQHIVL